MDINLRLTSEEVNGIINVLENLPTKSGAYPLVMKIKFELEEQTAKKEESNADA